MNTREQAEAMARKCAEEIWAFTYEGTSKEWIRSQVTKHIPLVELLEVARAADFIRRVFEKYDSIGRDSSGYSALNDALTTLRDRGAL